MHLIINFLSNTIYFHNGERSNLGQITAASYSVWTKVALTCVLTTKIRPNWGTVDSTSDATVCINESCIAEAMQSSAAEADDNLPLILYQYLDIYPVFYNKPAWISCSIQLNDKYRRLGNSNKFLTFLNSRVFSLRNAINIWQSFNFDEL